MNLQLCKVFNRESVTFSLPCHLKAEKQAELDLPQDLADTSLGAWPQTPNLMSFEHIKCNTEEDITDGSSKVPDATENIDIDATDENVKSILRNFANVLIQEMRNTSHAITGIGEQQPTAEIKENEEQEDINEEQKGIDEKHHGINDQTQENSPSWFCKKLNIGC